jgi:hypothetical protein
MKQKIKFWGGFFAGILGLGLFITLLGHFSSLPMWQDLAPTVEVVCFSGGVPGHESLPLNHPEIKVSRLYIGDPHEPSIWFELRRPGEKHGYLTDHIQTPYWGYNFTIREDKYMLAEMPRYPLNPGKYTLVGWEGHHQSQTPSGLRNLLFRIEFDVPECK